jgi:hypothetical protein
MQVAKGDKVRKTIESNCESQVFPAVATGIASCGWYGILNDADSSEKQWIDGKCPRHIRSLNYDPACHHSDFVVRETHNPRYFIAQ